ncbi:MAG: DUF1513 domain-containing protein [Polyangiaceae bacterium]|nr:DUF1513 domain-containing protein [Polyangiaceae bacterium]
MITPKLGVVVGPTRYMEPSTGIVRHTLDMVDLDAAPVGGKRTTERISLDFFAHGFALDPSKPHRAALFEKRGPGAGYVDLVDRTVLAPIAPLAGHAFYGHGAYSKSGDQLFAVEMNLESRDGVLTVRDPSTFEVRDRFPTYGAAPHDCHLVEDGAVLAVTNGGGPDGDPRTPSVAYVDVATRALIERFEVDDPAINAGHVAPMTARAFALVSAPRDGLPETTSLGGVSLRRRGSRLEKRRAPLEVTNRFIGESLSVCAHEPSRTVFATHPYGNVATLWSMDTGAILAAVDIESPRGVTLTLDGRYFAVSAGAKAALLLFEASPFRLARDNDSTLGRFGGSHVYTWKQRA